MMEIRLVKDKDHVAIILKDQFYALNKRSLKLYYFKQHKKHYFNFKI
jgi:hypothetical protein